jgi:murein endopeptidase
VPLSRRSRLALIAIALAALLTGAAVGAREGSAQSAAPSPPAPLPAVPALPGVPAPAVPPIAWQNSRAVGLPWHGRLVRGVQLPAEGLHWFTWDPALKLVPDRPWRRWGTDRLVRTILAVLDGYAAAHPEAPRVGVGDLSRPRGGPFGARYGGLGHASHQNGRDVDVYYPRVDRLERAAYKVELVDRALAQELVDRFVAAGAIHIFVGPRVGLRGPRGIVQVLSHHDDHLHVRIR